MTSITLVSLFFCHIKTCNDGCNTNEQMKLDLIFIHSITRISTAPWHVLFTRCWFVTYKAFNTSHEKREITQLELGILTFPMLQHFISKGSDTVKNENCFLNWCIVSIILKKCNSFETVCTNSCNQKFLLTSMLCFFFSK